MRKVENVVRNQNGIAATFGKWERHIAKTYKSNLPVLLLFGLVLMLFSGCSGEETHSNDDLWKAAMTDAVFSEDEEIFELVTLAKESPLVIWDDAGRRVLLLTWHDYEDECVPGSAIPEYGDIWATSLGEMEFWYTENGSDVEDWELRFAQLLGVHEDEGYTRFTAFWVRPEDVFRPAYITDVTRQMKNGYDQLTDLTYKAWFDQNILWSYFESDYPWTRLGYTYDWSGGSSEYGLTEFVVPGGTQTEIVFTYTTEEFVTWLDTQTGQ